MLLVALPEFLAIGPAFSKLKRGDVGFVKTGGPADGRKRSCKYPAERKGSQMSSSQQDDPREKAH